MQLQVLFSMPIATCSGFGSSCWSLNYLQEICQIKYQKESNGLLNTWQTYMTTFRSFNLVRYLFELPLKKKLRFQWHGLYSQGLSQNLIFFFVYGRHSWLGGWRGVFQPQSHVGRHSARCTLFCMSNHIVMNAFTFSARTTTRSCF